MIGVFLCSEAYHAFKEAEQCNRRVEEAFRALEGALEPAVQWVVKDERGNGAIEEREGSASIMASALSSEF